MPSASDGVVSWIIHNADWLSVTSGMLSAVVFAWPLLKGLAPQRFLDQLGRLKQNAAAPQSGSPRPAREDDSADISRIADDLIRERMGGYRASRSMLGFGLFFLFLSFVFNLLYAINKA